jgi:hypothetical protein
LYGSIKALGLEGWIYLSADAHRGGPPVFLEAF